MLILHSYHHGFAWTDNISNGIRSAFAEKGGSVELIFEFMDTRRIHTEPYFQALKAFLAVKYAGCKVDVIICSDDDSFHFMLTSGRGIFPDVPIVFCSVSGFQPWMRQDRQITGLLESIDIRSTLDLALTLHPETREVAVISDLTLTGRGLKEKARSVFSGYESRVAFRYLEDLTIEELKEQLSGLAEKTIVFLFLFSRDKVGRVFSHEENLSIIGSCCRAPIYAVWDFYLGHGIVGGKLTSGKAEGEMIGRTALRILGGERASDTPLDQSPARYMFDYKQIQRFRIQESRLPEGSVIINKPFSLYEAYRPFLWIAALVMILMALFIVMLLVTIQSRKRSEKALEKSEEQYRILVENAGEAIFIAQEGMLRFVNRKTEELVGYSREELTSRPFTDFIHPDDHALVLERHVKRQQGIAVPASYSFRILSKASQVKWVELNAVAVDWQGKAATLNFLRDITERHEAEEILRRTERFLSKSQEISHVGSWELDLAANKLTWSDEVFRIFGLTPEESPASYEAFLAAVHPEDRDRVEAAYSDSVQDGKDQYEIEHRIVRPHTAEVRIVHEKCEHMKDASGKIVRSVGMVQDITEQKQAAMALQESEERFRTLVEQSPLGISLIGKDGRYKYINPGFTDMLGYTLQDLPTGTDWFRKAFPNERDRSAAVSTWLEDFKQAGVGQSRPRIFAVTCKDGTRKTIHFRPVTLENLDQFVIYEDITQRTLMERQLQQAQKMESVGRLAGGVAHDFNNMLGVILGRAEMMLMGMEPRDPYYADLEEIRKAAQRSANLTRQLLAFARRQTASPKIIDLNDTLAGMLKMLRRLIGEDIDLAWMPGAELWPIKIDPAQIDQILANLCVNARDAIGGIGKITIETQNITLDRAYCARHPGFVPGAYVMLAVSDDGAGMDQETIDNLFEPFFTTKGVGEGTGLGLAMVYGIVKQNDGFINVYSEPGQGATFKLYFPRTQEIVEAKEEPSSVRIPKGTETVMLVEDEESVLGLCRTVLAQFGYTVLEARTPGEALAVAERHEGAIHLLITDVVMPEMNGKELRARIERLRPKIKVLFMSGYTANVILHRGILEKDVHFLQKPFSVHSLAGKVREVLDQPA